MYWTHLALGVKNSWDRLNMTINIVCCKIRGIS